MSLALPVAGAGMAQTLDGEAGQRTDEGFSLIEEGTKLILRQMLDNMKPAMDEAQKGLGQAMAEWGPAMRDLAGRLGDLSAYHAPEVLPNGDILIRRKRPGETPPPGLTIGPHGETDL